MKKITTRFIIGTFVTLYLVVSVISTIHVIDFFLLSNPSWLAISLAVAFEIGAAASLASIIAMDKMNKALIWFLFIVLTLMQMMGNAYYAYMHLEDFQGWVELFGLVDEEVIFQKRVLSIISGAILPLVSLGFIKSLVDYVKPTKESEIIATQDAVIAGKEAETKKIFDDIIRLKAEGKLSNPSKEDIDNEPTALANSQYREKDEDWEEIEKNLDSNDTPEVTEEKTYTEEDKKQILESITDSPNSQSSVEINNINKELSEDDIKKYEEATKLPDTNVTFHPQINR